MCPVASASSWWPRQIPRIGTRPIRWRSVHLLGFERRRVAWAVREQDAVVADELVGVDVVRVDGHRGARPGETVQDRALAAVVDDRDVGPARVREDVRLAGRDLRRERPPGHLRLRPHGAERLVDRRLTGQSDRTHRARLAEVEDERARVDPGQGDDAAVVEPVRPARSSGLAHHDGAGVGGRRLRPDRSDSVVADHGRREADDLIRVARVGDDLLVAGHRGREDRLAERVALGADGLAPEERPVLEEQEPVHDPCTSRPAAIVARTRPRSFSPSSHEFLERLLKPSSATCQLACVSSRTRFACAPTATFGGSRP